MVRPKAVWEEPDEVGGAGLRASRVCWVQLLVWHSHPSQAVRGSLKTVLGSVCVRAGTGGTPPLEDEEKRGGKVGSRLPF